MAQPFQLAGAWSGSERNGASKNFAAQILEKQSGASSNHLMGKTTRPLNICSSILVARPYHSQCLPSSSQWYLLMRWRFLAWLISAPLLSATDTQAAAITVTNGNDSGPGSFRQAIVDASSGDTINFAPGVTVINLTSDALVINKNLTVTGPPAGHLVVQRTAPASFPIFSITPNNVVAQISGVTISNGGLGEGNTQGGIYSEGYVVVTNCVLSNNVPAAVYVTGGLTISDSTIRNNGVGIINLGDTDITNCTIADNVAGGGVYNGVNMTIYSSTISGNVTSFDGGGLGNDGFLSVTNCTISDNTASGYGGGIRNGNNISNSAVLGISSSTISGNSSANGGGIYNYGTLYASVNSTLIALNSAPSGPDGTGTFTSAGFNLIGKEDGTAGFTQSTDQTGTIGVPLDPRLDLAGLQNNGGPTPTIALLADSPAIERGDPIHSGRDQRGYERVGVADVGAFEFNAGYPRYDFNGDGKPDYVLYKASTLQTAIWYLNNNVFVGGNYGPILPQAWTVIDVADFNTDGKPDYLLYNVSTHRTAIWYLSNSDYRGGAYGPTLPNGWQPVATADFNGDGKPDYALYNASTRQTAIWYLDNNIYISSTYAPTLPAGWRVINSVDFNDDRKPDYLLFNPTTRQSAIWYLNDNVYVRGAYGPTIASGYALVGTADFNRDGHPDYVLYNSVSRQTAIWYLNDNVYVSGAYGPTPPAGWSLVGQ